MKSPDMTGSDYDSVGSGKITDMNDHEDMNVPSPGYAPRMQHGTQMAGDVLPMPNMGGSGQTSSAVDYATGRSSDSKIKSIGTKTISDWASRTSKRLGQ